MATRINANKNDFINQPTPKRLLCVTQILFGFCLLKLKGLVFLHYLQICTKNSKL